MVQDGEAVGLNGVQVEFDDERVVCDAGVMLVATLPLMALIALIVRLDSPGPVVFRQTRIGRDGRLFNRRRQFGTMVLSKLPIVWSRLHALPMRRTLRPRSTTPRQMVGESSRWGPPRHEPLKTARPGMRAWLRPGLLKRIRSSTRDTGSRSSADC